MRLFLFDIDGTLISARGLGRAALKTALERVFGTAGAIDEYDLRGKTDPRILHDVLGAAGIPRATIEARVAECFEVYVRELANRGGMFRKIGANFDGDVTVGWWSKDGKTIFFDEGVRATDQLCSVDVATGEVKQLTHEKASLRASQDVESGRITITYSDPKTPPTLFTVASVGDIVDRAKWVQLTDANPWVRSSLELGDEEEISWKSKDGRMVGGVLLKPVGYQAGKRYPLIVAIHGGPAAADVLNFNGGYGSQVTAILNVSGPATYYVDVGSNGA